MFKTENRTNKWDRLMAAITFAEAGERDTALEVMRQDWIKKKQKRTRPKIKKRDETRPAMRL